VRDVIITFMAMVLDWFGPEGTPFDAVPVTPLAPLRWRYVYWGTCWRA
jgi:hypothetical protein